ncbi:hypothetical protein K443DRAFT_683300 [Laccaria amethystina LaAM-08-1]|uniref:Uncharacterized protein n=1 Tax=Laccaria amethystina LaAM-08-1 TaxID=1095629 RepID=A0A0C9WJQ7_9AGAR|nr:hypothetical protein K443DRAFT_683300 [Laccaria amethystina LaAM-08-1]
MNELRRTTRSTSLNIAPVVGRKSRVDDLVLVDPFAEGGETVNPTTTFTLSYDLDHSCLPPY